MFIKFHKYVIISLLTLFCLSLPVRAHSAVFRKNTTVMGTDLEITVSIADKTSAEKAFDAVIKEMVRIEQVMSEWRENTLVSQINRNAGIRAVVVNDELFNVISAALQVSELSGGAFDISWAGMREIWRFEKGKERVPSDQEIKDKITLVDYREIELNREKKTVFLRKKGMSIGLGGIAKGYAVDMAMQALVNSGIKDAIVKAGGDMRIQGTEDGKPWEIGIQHPRNRDKLIARLKLSNISISTSGDYERFFIKDGVLYHHIIDPKTGYPAKECSSVTIIGPDTMTTDALSTAVFVLGPEKGMKLIRSLNGIEGIIADGTGKIYTSPGISLE